VASVNRITGILKAALNLAASNDRKRITNTWEWTDGLGSLEGGDVARNVFLADDDIDRIVAAAYQDSLEFGLYVSLAVHTGARPSQLARHGRRPAGDGEQVAPHAASGVRATAPTKDEGSMRDIPSRL
jgi:integrase